MTAERKPEETFDVFGKPFTVRKGRLIVLPPDVRIIWLAEGEDREVRLYGARLAPSEDSVRAIDKVSTID